VTAAASSRTTSSMSQVWRISLSNLSRNLLEATELANVLQEVSSSIQVGSLILGSSNLVCSMQKAPVICLQATAAVPQAA
jgi:hypothetical protein